MVRLHISDYEHDEDLLTHLEMQVEETVSVPYRPSRYQMRLWAPAMRIVTDMRYLLHDDTLTFSRLPINILEIVQYFVEKHICEEYGIPTEYIKVEYSCNGEICQHSNF